MSSLRLQEKLYGQLGGWKERRLMREDDTEMTIYRRSDYIQSVREILRFRTQNSMSSVSSPNERAVARLQRRRNCWLSE
jgi:hypothetical protein